MPDPHDRRSARVGLADAIVGQLIIAAAEVIWPSIVTLRSARLAAEHRA